MQFISKLIHNHLPSKRYSKQFLILITLPTFNSSNLLFAVLSSFVFLCPTMWWSFCSIILDLVLLLIMMLLLLLFFCCWIICMCLCSCKSCFPFSCCCCWRVSWTCASSSSSSSSNYWCVCFCISCWCYLLYGWLHFNHFCSHTGCWCFSSNYLHLLLILSFLQHSASTASTASYFSLKFNVFSCFLVFLTAYSDFSPECAYSQPVVVFFLFILVGSTQACLLWYYCLWIFFLLCNAGSLLILVIFQYNWK